MKTITFMGIICLFTLIFSSIIIHEGVHLTQSYENVSEVCFVGYNMEYYAIGWVKFYGTRGDDIWSQVKPEIPAYIIQFIYLLWVGTKMKKHLDKVEMIK